MSSSQASCSSPRAPMQELPRAPPARWVLKPPSRSGAAAPAAQTRATPVPGPGVAAGFRLAAQQRLASIAANHQIRLQPATIRQLHATDPLAPLAAAREPLHHLPWIPVQERLLQGLLQQGLQQQLLWHQPARLQAAHRLRHVEQLAPVHPHAPARQGPLGQARKQGAQPHACQCLLAAGHQRIAAKLAAELPAGFHQCNALAGARQLKRQAQPGRPCTHHHEPVHQAVCSSG